MLDREFNFFKHHQRELVERYPGKHLVIKGEEVLGAYDSEIQAYTEAQKLTPLGTFLIQESRLGEEVYTQTFHSRVVFA